MAEKMLEKAIAITSGDTKMIESRILPPMSVPPLLTGRNPNTLS